MPTPKALRRYRAELQKGAGAEDSYEKPLLPWEFTFAEWLARQPNRLPVSDQVAQASDLAGVEISPRALSSLKSRKAYKTYYGQLQQDELKRSRAMLEKRYPKFVEAHEKGLDMALESKDHRAIPTYTGPILDRVAPKKDTAQAVAAIKIELSPRQQELLDAELPVVEAEVLHDDPDL